MATCPRCRSKRNYPLLLFLGKSSTLDCKRCGIFLRARLNEARLLVYALLAASGALILASSVVLWQDFVTTILLLLGWTVISWTAYPLALVLEPDPRSVLQSESK